MDSMKPWMGAFIRALATRFALYAIPQFYLYRDGKRLGKMSEFRGDAFFLQVLRDHLPVEPA